MENVNVVSNASPPPYNHHNFREIKGKWRQYYFRQGVHILLAEDGQLHLQGDGVIHTKNRLTFIPDDQYITVSQNVATINGNDYYVYNRSPKEHFTVYGNDGRLILKPGKSGACVIF